MSATRNRGGVVRVLNGALRKLPVWPIYLGAVPYILWLLYLGQSGALGPEPINALERELGRTGLQLLLAGLAITPLLRFTRLNLIRFRRAVGLSAFLYILCHLAVWLFLDVALLSEIWGDIVKRPYITVGMAGFVALVPLALSSNDWSVRHLGGARWRRLHRLTYVAVILGAVHFVMIGKTWQIESLLYLGAAIFLLSLRIPRGRRAARTDSRSR